MSETETDTESPNVAPMDVLDEHLTEDVTVRLKSGATYRGGLSGYDQHLNLVLTDIDEEDGAAPTITSEVAGVPDQLVIRGDTVVTVTLSG